MDIADIPAALSATSTDDFNQLAAEAAALGPPAITALTLVAREAHTPIAQLCAIKALGLIQDPRAAEARRWVSSLTLKGARGKVVRAAAGSSQWPFDLRWNADARLQELGASPASGNRPRVASNRTGATRPGGVCIHGMQRMNCALCNRRRFPGPIKFRR